MLANERDWYGAMKLALREPCRRNNTVLPHGNRTDCEVIVCLYIWSIVVGEPMKEPCSLKIEDLMKIERSKIGSIIVSKSNNNLKYRIILLI